MHWKGLEVNKKVLRCFLKSNSRSFGTLFSTFLKSENMSSHQLNSNNNDPVLLVKTIFRHCTCFLSSVATDGTDERIIIRFWETAHLPLPYTNINAYFSLRAKYLLRGGVRWAPFSGFNAMPEKITTKNITVSALWRNLFQISSK